LRLIPDRCDTYFPPKIPWSSAYAQSITIWKPNNFKILKKTNFTQMELNRFCPFYCYWQRRDTCLVVCLMVFNATFNNISVISWRSVLLVEETGGPEENHRPVASHWQTLSHNGVYLALIEIRTHNISGHMHWILLISRHWYYVDK
jgi:hypothetical protein